MASNAMLKCLRPMCFLRIRHDSRNQNGSFLLVLFIVYLLIYFMSFYSGNFFKEVLLAIKKFL